MDEVEPGYADGFLDRPREQALGSAVAPLHLAYRVQDDDGVGEGSQQLGQFTVRARRCSRGHYPYNSARRRPYAQGIRSP